MSRMRERAGAAGGRWFAVQKPARETRLRLFCFPYAGGTAQIYRAWGAGLPGTIEVCAAQIPGRGPRMNEAPYTNLAPLVEALTGAVAPLLDKPFAFFGHSMGAMIAFELARALQRERGVSPLHLFVSGRRAPQLPDDEPPTYNLPHDEFLEELRRLNGTPEEVLRHPEMMELLLPIIRADFSAVQTYDYRPGPPLDCPVTAFGGTEDHEVGRDDLEAWREQTSAGFSVQMFRGDHFFLHDAQPLLQSVAHQLQPHLA